MKNLLHLHTGPIETNTYLFACGDAWAVVDPGGDTSNILKLAGNKPISFVLLTHAHWDHTGAVADLQAKGAKVYLHEKEAPNASASHRVFGKVAPDILIKDGDVLDLNGVAVTVMHTPGHSAGSVCYLVEDIIFSGDTLFKGEIGRCDLPSSDYGIMKNTLRKLFAIEKDYRVLAGHGDESTLLYEKKHNPYATV